MKKITIFLLAVLLVFTFCSCDKKIDGPKPTITVDDFGIHPNGTITLSYNGSEESDQKIIDAFVDAYTKKYPDVTVVKDYSVEDIKVRMASGEIGDVFYFKGSQLYDYAITMKALLPLNQFIDPLNIDFPTVYKNALYGCDVNGILYMVPTEYNPLAMIYNKTAITTAGLPLPENGWTWSDFKDYCAGLTKKEGDLYTQVGGYLNYTWEPVYMSFMEGWSGKLNNLESHSVNLNSPEVCDGIEELLELAETGVIKPEGKSDLSAYMELDDTDYVFRTITYNQLEAYSKQYESKGLEWDLVSFPAFPVSTVGVEVSGLGVYKYTKNASAAAALTLFLMTEEGQTAMFNAPNKSVPINKVVGKMDIWKYNKSKNMEAFIYQDDVKASVTPETDAPTKVADVVKKCWGSLTFEYFNGGDYKKALEEAGKMANEEWDKITNALL